MSDHDEDSERSRVTFTLPADLADQFEDHFDQDDTGDPDDWLQTKVTGLLDPPEYPYPRFHDDPFTEEDREVIQHRVTSRMQSLVDRMNQEAELRHDSHCYDGDYVPAEMMALFQQGLRDLVNVGRTVNAIQGPRLAYLEEHGDPVTKDLFESATFQSLLPLLRSFMYEYEAWRRLHVTDHHPDRVTHTPIEQPVQDPQLREGREIT